MPPFSEIAGEAVFLHKTLEHPGIFRRFRTAVGIIPVCQSRKIIKLRGHLHFPAHGIHHGQVNGIAPAVGAVAGLRIRHIGRIRTDFPQGKLGGHRPEAVPDLQSQPLQSQCFLHRHQLFHGSIAQIAGVKVIDDLSGEIVLLGIFQFHRNPWDIVRHVDKGIVPGFPLLGSRLRFRDRGFRRFCFHRNCLNGFGNLCLLSNRLRMLQMHMMLSASGQHHANADSGPNKPMFSAHFFFS